MSRWLWVLFVPHVVVLMVGVEVRDRRKLAALDRSIDESRAKTERLIAESEAESERFHRDRAKRAKVRYGNGSGAIVCQGDGNIFILTAKHVVGPGLVTLSTGERLVNERVIAEHPQADLALIMVPYSGPVVCLKIAKTPPGDETLFSMGSPIQANEPEFYVHRITGKASLNQLGWRGQFYVTDKQVSPGCSGGPLCNSRGEIVGVASAAGGGASEFSTLEEIHALCRIAAWPVE